MAPTYSFPILGNNEIIACLGELDIPLTEQDLLRPHPDTLYRAYEEIVCLLCGQTREAMYAPDLEAADVLEFPELYEDAIGNLKFQRQLFELMRCCGVPDFTLKDLMKPEYTRTRRNISAVINFAKFREEKVADYEETQAEHDAVDQRLADAKKRNAELKAEIARIQAERDEEKDSVERQKALRDEWAAKAKDAEAARDVVAEQKAAVEQALAAVKATEDATKAKVLEAEAEMAALEAQLVKGPVATAELEALTLRCAEEQAKLDAETTKVKALEAKVEGMKDLCKDVAKACEYAEEVLVDHQKKRDASTKLKEAKKKLTAMEERVYEITAKVETLRRQDANFAEKMARLKNQGELKRQAAEAKLKAAQEELAAVKARRAANGARAAEESNQVEVLRRKIEQARADHHAEVEALLRNFGSLREQVSVYHEQLADAMDIARADRVPLALVERDANGDFTNTYQWTNYDTMNFGGIGKGKPSLAAVGRPNGAPTEEFTMSGP